MNPGRLISENVLFVDKKNKFHQQQQEFAKTSKITAVLIQESVNLDLPT